MKKNFRKIPEHIEAKLNQISSDKIIVASVVDVTESEINNGKFSHLMITKLSDLYSPKIILPKITSGRFSKVNILGMVKVRRDLPKTLKTIDLGLRPNFGDWSRGSHNISYDKPVYQKYKIIPKNLKIITNLLETTEVSGQKIYSVKFQLDRYLNKSDKNFSSELFFYINFFQENIGEVGVFSIQATKNEFLKSVFVNWEILPPGQRDVILSKLLKTYKKITENLINKIDEKRNFFYSLNPIKEVIGLSGKKRYIGAMFSENLVVFENIDYGNAIYILFTNWRELSQLSKSELRKKNQNEVIIVEHRNDWKEQVKKIVQEKR